LNNKTLNLFDFTLNSSDANEFIESNDNENRGHLKGILYSAADGWAPPFVRNLHRTLNLANKRRSHLTIIVRGCPTAPQPP